MAIHNSYHLEHFFNWAYRYVGTSTNPSAFCKISSAIIFHLCIWLQNVNICCCSCLFLYKLRVSIVLLSGFPHTNVSFIFDIYYDNISTFTIYARMSNLPRNGGHTLFFPLRIYSNMMSLSLRSFFTPFHPVIEFECLKVAASGWF